MLKKNMIAALLCSLLLLQVVVAAASPITPAGYKLLDKLDGMQVETYWLPGSTIEWDTGYSTGRKGTTHCSAFAAAFASRMDVYLLRPPQHPQMRLANAQYHWLSAKSAEQGWSKVETPQQAQELANQGWLVIVSYLNPDPLRPGHIAVVRPSEKSDDLLHKQGPQITQAGLHNHNSTTVKIGFSNHPDAWKDSSNYNLIFYAHKIEGITP